MPPEKSICRSRSNSLNHTWNSRLVPNWERSISGCILSPCLFNFYAEYIMRNARLAESQAGIRISRKNIYFCFIDYIKSFDGVDHNKLENSERDGNTRPPDLPPENSVYRSRSNSKNQTRNNRLVPTWERSISGCILSPCLLNLSAEYIMRNAGLDEAQTRIKIAGRNYQ